MNELQRLRYAQGLSLRKLADLSHVDQSTISRLERGHQKAYASTLYRLAVALNVPIETFDELLDTSIAERGRKGGIASSGVPKKDIPAPILSRAGMSRKEAVLVEAVSSFS